MRDQVVAQTDEAPVEDSGANNTVATIVGRGVRWSPAEVSRLKEMIQRGTTIPEIATDLGRRPTAVAAKATKLGFLEAAGDVDDKRRKRWTSRDQEAFRNMANQGQSAEAIAEALGRSVSGVRERLNAIRRYLS
jgi:hypothetical protein